MTAGRAGIESTAAAAPARASVLSILRSLFMAAVTVNSSAFAAMKKKPT
jgi:hypothetical protein